MYNSFYRTKSSSARISWFLKLLSGIFWFGRKTLRDGCTDPEGGKGEIASPKVRSNDIFTKFFRLIIEEEKK